MGAVVVEKPHVTTTPRTDEGVDVALLLDTPEEALLPVLKLLPGPWATAQLEDLQCSAMSGALSESLQW